MSNIPNYDSNNKSSQLRPDQEPFEDFSAAGGTRGPDFNSQNMDTAGFGAQPQSGLGEFGNSGVGTGTGMDRPGQGFEGQTRDYDTSNKNFSTDASGRGEMPLNTGGTTQNTQGSTGVGQRGYESGSTTKPSVGDKITGGTQKLAGKMMNNPGMQQKGEVRETMGKSGNTNL